MNPPVRRGENQPRDGKHVKKITPPRDGKTRRALFKKKTPDEGFGYGRAFAQAASKGRVNRGGWSGIGGAKGARFLRP